LRNRPGFDSISFGDGIRIERDGLIKIEKDKLEAEFRNGGDPVEKIFRLDDATRALSSGFSDAEAWLDCRKRIGDG
jgi:hypothetical protein